MELDEAIKKLKKAKSNEDNGKKVNIDIWAKAYEVKFGDYSHGFV